MSAQPGYGKYEAVIGLEVHAQMLTGTKIFCGCPVRFGASPNSQTCPVCAGMPGVLPVLNRKALEIAVRTGLALNCRVSPLSRFARKNYFYPDLPKGYQISQYELPICEAGWVDIPSGGAMKRIGITRVHMEDDAGKNIHGSGGSLVDLNRTGTPLMEIVSEPDIRAPEEASAYMRALRSILRYIDASDGNMEEGSLRCDANISIRPVGSDKLGTKVELKNINSFRFVERAMAYEIRRQIKVTGESGRIAQETRLYDPERDITVSMRSKEEAHDYRYFPDPDLVPIVVDTAWVEELRKGLPELPSAKQKRYVMEDGLSDQDAEALTASRNIAEYYEDAAGIAKKEGVQPKAIANRMRSDLLPRLNEAGAEIQYSNVSSSSLVGLEKLIQAGQISSKMAKTVFDDMYTTGQKPDMIVLEKGLVQITDTAAIEKAVDDVLGANQAAVERYKSGDEKIIGFFVGQIMKATKGKANPQAVNEILRRKLAP